MNWLLSRATLCRLAFLPFALALFSCHEVFEAPRIERTAAGVEGFDLVFDESDTRAEFGLFEIGYAIKANYGYFNYRGKTYHSVGGGSVLIRPISSSSANFEVRETVRSKDELGRVNSSLLQILDKQSGQELARRRLVAGVVEDGTGWTGDHAVKFVRSVLVSPREPGRPWGPSDYRRVSAQVTLAQATESPPYSARSLPIDCPASLKIERRPYNSTVSGPSFEFLPKSPLKLVTCSDGIVLVASGVYASDFHFDLLTPEGEHLSQGYVRLPLPLEAHWAELKVVSLEARSIEVMLLANSRVDWKSPPTALATVNVRASSK